MRLKQNYLYVFLIWELCGVAVFRSLWVGFHGWKDSVWQKCHCVILLTNPTQYFAFQICMKMNKEGNMTCLLLVSSPLTNSQVTL